MQFLRSFSGLVTGPNQLWLRPAINWSQPVWTTVVLYICSNKDIFTTILLAQGGTHGPCLHPTWWDACIQHGKVPSVRRGGVPASDMAGSPCSTRQDACVR